MKLIHYPFIVPAPTLPAADLPLSAVRTPVRTLVKLRPIAARPSVEKTAKAKHTQTKLTQTNHLQAKVPVFGSGYWVYYHTRQPLSLSDIMDPLAAMVRSKRLSVIGSADVQGRLLDSIYIPGGMMIRLWANNPYQWHNRLRLQQDLLLLKPLFNRLGLEFSHVEVETHNTPRYEWDV
jgi:hypothetical protein